MLWFFDCLIESQSKQSQFCRLRYLNKVFPLTLSSFSSLTWRWANTGILEMLFLSFPLTLCKYLVWMESQTSGFMCSHCPVQSSGLDLTAHTVGYPLAPPDLLWLSSKKRKLKCAASTMCKSNRQLYCCHSSTGWLFPVHRTRHDATSCFHFHWVLLFSSSAVTNSVSSRFKLDLDQTAHTHRYQSPGKPLNQRIKMLKNASQC